MFYFIFSQNKNVISTHATPYVRISLIKVYDYMDRYPIQILVNYEASCSSNYLLNQHSAAIHRPCPPCDNNNLERVILQSSHNTLSRAFRTKLRNPGVLINTAFCKKTANCQQCADNPTLHLKIT